MRVDAACAGAAILLLTACAMPPVPVPPPSIRTVEAIRRTTLPPLAVGAFVPAPALRDTSDRSLGSRGGLIRPEGKSFAAYLGETIVTQLKVAGRFDPQSNLSISGTLTRNQLATGVEHGRATIEAEIVVRRSGSEIFRRTIMVSAEWPGNFIGAVAVPIAEQHYSGLYPQLAEQLLTNPEFLAAVRGST